jgi:hypothetical protein
MSFFLKWCWHTCLGAISPRACISSKTLWGGGGGLRGVEDVTEQVREWRVDDSASSRVMVRAGGLEV